MTNYLDFREELKGLINIHSMENSSNTQDFVLANYLTACLIAYDNAVVERDRLEIIGNVHENSELLDKPS